MDQPPIFGRYIATKKIFDDLYRAQVWLVDDPLDPTPKVVKMVSFKFDSEEEAFIHLSIPPHPNIVRCYETFTIPASRCMVIERCGMRLHDAIMGRMLDTSGLRDTFRDVIHGLEHLQRNRIVHRDIKPENVLLGANEAKIIDFGSAYRFRDADKESMGLSTDFIGTTWQYAPPEIFFGKMIPTLTHSYPVDIWSLGLVIYEAFSHRTLVTVNTGDNHIEVAKRMAGLFPRCLSYLSHSLRAEVTETIDIDISALPDDVANLFWKMVEVDQSKRATIGEVLSHPFFSGSK